MIVWSSRKLEKALARGDVDAWTKAKYLMIPTIIGALAGPFYVFRPVYGARPPPFNSLFSFIFALMTAYLTYWGIKKCFQVNRQIDGKEFFERFAVLLVPVFVRIISVSLLSSIVLLIILGILTALFPKLLSVAPGVFTALVPILTFAMYMMLCASFRRLGVMVRRGKAR